ncbi:MAG: hypothetical protein VCD31_05740 [Alphaproteobacteria bacterium]
MRTKEMRTSSSTSSTSKASACLGVGLILSHRTAHTGFLVLGKIIKHLGLQIGALGEIKPHRTIFGCDGKLRRGIIHAPAEFGSRGFWRLFAGARRKFTQ